VRLLLLLLRALPLLRPSDHVPGTVSLFSARATGVKALARELTAITTPDSGKRERKRAVCLLAPDPEDDAEKVDGDDIALLSSEKEGEKDEEKRRRLSRRGK
jgi:hypothetical protein